jgi:hypothetical protein
MSKKTASPEAWRKIARKLIRDIDAIIERLEKARAETVKQKN